MNKNNPWLRDTVLSMDLSKDVEGLRTAFASLSDALRTPASSLAEGMTRTLDNLSRVVRQPLPPSAAHAPVLRSYREERTRLLLAATPLSPPEPPPQVLPKVFGMDLAVDPDMQGWAIMQDGKIVASSADTPVRKPKRPIRLDDPGE